MDIIGTLIKKLPVQSGESARGGEWQKQEFVIQTTETYPKKICFNVWGPERVNELVNYNEGDTIKVFFNIESREYNERWYTDLRAWRMEKVIPSTTPPAAPLEGSRGATNVGDEISVDGEDDLPF